MDKKTIIGLCFECKKCGKLFRVGTRGMEAIDKRIRKHIMDCGSIEFWPKNPPVGLTYKAEHGDKTLIYKGGDVKKFCEKVKATVMETRDNMIPQLKLTEA